MPSILAPTSRRKTVRPGNERHMVNAYTEEARASLKIAYLSMLIAILAAAIAIIGPPPPYPPYGG